MLKALRAYVSRRRRRVPVASAALVLALLLVPAGASAPAYGPSTMLFADPVGSSSFGVSDDARYVGYLLGSGQDLFVLDRENGASERVTVPITADGYAVSPAALSATGRIAAFTTLYAGVFVAGAPSGHNQALVRDLDTDTTVVVSRAASYANADASAADVSADGSTVSFNSRASNLASPDGNACTEEVDDILEPTNCSDVFVRDLASGVLEKVSVPDSATGASEANGHSFGSWLSASGRFVAFYSDASNLVAGDTNGSRDMFVRDRVAGTTQRVSVTSNGAELATGARPWSSSVISGPISTDGRFVVFESQSPELTPPADGFTTNLFLRDRALDQTTQITPSPSGGTLASISADGNYVFYQRWCCTMEDQQAYVWSRLTGETTLVSVAADGNPADASANPRAITGDGSVIVFESRAANLGTPIGPYGHASQVFLRGPVPAFVDSDGDGVEDAVDVGAGAFSDTSLAPPTSGTIVSANGLDVRVEDADDPADGVKVTVGAGAGRVTLSVCDGMTVRVAAGSEVIVTCGSVTVEVLEGAAEIPLGGGITVVSVPAGATVKVTANGDGTFTVANLTGPGGSAVTVTVDGVQTTVAPGASKAVATYDFHGFFAPVDNPGTTNLLNVVKAGQAVPLRWRLTDAAGAPIPTLASAQVAVSNLSCGLSTTTDQLEEVAAGASGLQNLGNGYYQLNWKTNSAWRSSCKTMHLDLGEGITRTALFKFTR